MILGSRRFRMKSRSIADLIALRHDPVFDYCEGDAGFLDGVIAVLQATKRKPNPRARYAREIAALEEYAESAAVRRLANVRTRRTPTAA